MNEKWKIGNLKIRKQIVSIFVCFFLSCISLSGCGMKDQAIVIPDATVGGQESIVENAWNTSNQDNNSNNNQQNNQNPSNGSEQEKAKQEATLCVFVCGAVKSPGVVTLPVNSRVQDALEAAGGFASEADQNAVNLAGMLTDGQKVYFPTVQETVQVNWQQEGDDASVLVNINTADVAKLCTLPGIGESRAQAIIMYRTEKGAFAKKEDIMKVSGIKQGAYDKIKDLITVK